MNANTETSMGCEHYKTCGGCHSPAAVRQLELSVNYLANQLAYAAECNLATLDTLMMRKRTPKSEVARQKSICLKMLQALENEWAHVLVTASGSYRVRDIFSRGEKDLAAKFEAWSLVRV